MSRPLLVLTHRPWLTFGQYEQSDPVLKVPLCSHWFHKACLEVSLLCLSHYFGRFLFLVQQWLGTANSCPVCRGRVDPNSAASSSRAHTTRARLRRINLSAHAGNEGGLVITSDSGNPLVPATSEETVENRDEVDTTDEEEREWITIQRSLRLLRRDRESGV